MSESPGTGVPPGEPDVPPEEEPDGQGDPASEDNPQYGEVQTDDEPEYRDDGDADEQPPASWSAQTE